MVYNQKRTFGLCPAPGTELLKLSQFPSGERNQGVFRCVNEMTLDLHLKDGGWLPGEPAGCMPCSHPHPRRRGAGGLISDSANPAQVMQMQPAPVFLPGKPHGQRSLAGYSPWGLEDSDVTY